MSSLGQLRNPYANMSSFLGQWGQERDKQKQIDLQNQRQAVLDGYAKDQNQRQQESSQRQATLAKHQNTLFDEKQDVFKQNQNQKDYNKAFNSASTYYRKNPNNPAFKEAYLNTKALADPETVQAEQGSWDKHLKIKSFLKTQANARTNQEITRKNATLNQQVLRNQLNTIQQTKQYNAAFNNVGKEMQEKSKQLGDSINDHTILDSLSPEDHDLFMRGTATPDAYNSLSTTDKVKFDNLQKAIASNSVNLYDTVKKRQAELDPTDTFNRLNYMDDSGNFKDNNVFNDYLVKKTQHTQIARSKQLTKFNKQLQELVLAKNPGDAKIASSYVTQVKNYNANISNSMKNARTGLSDAEKKDATWSKKIANLALKGYSSTQIISKIRNASANVGSPMYTKPVKSLDLTGAEKTQAQMDNIKSKIALLNEKHTPIGSIDVNKIAKDSFGNINVNATPEQINAKKADIQSRLNKVSGISTKTTKNTKTKTIEKFHDDSWWYPGAKVEDYDSPILFYKAKAKYEQEHSNWDTIKREFRKQ